MKIGIDLAYYNKCESNIVIEKQILNPAITLNEIGTALMKRLEDFGLEVINCSPNNFSENESPIENTIRKVNDGSIDLFLSIHLNSFSNAARNGSDIFVNSKDGIAYEKGKKIKYQLSNLGYSTREIRLNENIKLLKEVNCESILVHCFFSTNHWDCKRYNKEHIVSALFKALTSNNIFNFKNSISC